MRQLSVKIHAVENVVQTFPATNVLWHCRRLLQRSDPSAALAYRARLWIKFARQKLVHPTLSNDFWDTQNTQIPSSATSDKRLDAVFSEKIPGKYPPATLELEQDAALKFLKARPIPFGL
ncbi:hypothetical protein HPB49_004304 [Dermacentor silvarum]|uniref:Uncharacterized protein n=1 Tax=Dermacentor silvarum TaxID=543639 RepID=A0ACB8DUU1_DERSI|nr:hypothetical protein HPB49_004304 [Dermacentor silvarum]